MVNSYDQGCDVLSSLFYLLFDGSISLKDIFCCRFRWEFVEFVKPGVLY